MFNFAKWPVVLIAVILNGYVPLVSGESSVNRQLVASLQEMLPSLVSSGDYRTASNVALQLASAHKRLGETPAACAALARSLEHYRNALVKEAGASASSSISDDSDVLATLYDDSDGMAEVRAKFGCNHAIASSK
jgi:hypothetical protein